MCARTGYLSGTGGVQYGYVVNGVLIIYTVQYTVYSTDDVQYTVCYICIFIYSSTSATV